MGKVFYRINKIYRIRAAEIDRRNMKDMGEGRRGA
jgi:hypothetical protein